MPIKDPTVTRLMLATVATRRPAMMTGMAAGKSTLHNRRNGAIAHGGGRDADVSRARC